MFRPDSGLGDVGPRHVLPLQLAHVVDYLEVEVCVVARLIGGAFFNKFLGNCGSIQLRYYIPFGGSCRGD